MTWYENLDSKPAKPSKMRAAGQPVATRGELYMAIRDKCMDCMAHEDARNRIRTCEAEGVCPLWPFGRISLDA